MKQIPQYEPLFSKEEAVKMKRYLDSGGWLTEFQKTKTLEERLCELIGTKYCVMTPNGTLSLFLALKAMGIGKGDEVIVPNLTMAATPNAVLMAGATPVFVDIEENSWCMDALEAQRAITKKTKAVIHVSLNGRAGELLRLKEICRREKILLLEDAAQALGSEYQNKQLGTFGLLGSFSLSIPKIVTTGQGGFVVTNDPRLYKRMAMLKDFGRISGGIDEYRIIGWNLKFTDLQAVIGLVQLKQLHKRVRMKKKIYETYRRYLSHIPEVSLVKTDLKNTTPWFVDIRVNNRARLMAFLEKKGIGTRPVYPALHAQAAYAKSALVKAKKRYPVSDKIAKEGLWLPSSMTLGNNEIRQVCEAIKEFYK